MRCQPITPIQTRISFLNKEKPTEPKTVIPEQKPDTFTKSNEPKERIL